MSMSTKYILEYRFDGSFEDDWREEACFNSPSEAQEAFIEHVKDYSHTLARVRKVRYIVEEEVIAAFNPISADEFPID